MEMRVALGQKATENLAIAPVGGHRGPRFQHIGGKMRS